MTAIQIEKLEYIKTVTDKGDAKWAYQFHPKNSYFELNFHRIEGVENHVLKLPKGDMIILSQTSKSEDKRYLTHVVELVNEGLEDQPQWRQDEWGIFRWVKVHWVADFDDISSIPLDQDVMKVNWGWYNGLAKQIARENNNLMKEWESIENLREHLKSVFV
jgi:hypothetical protein